MLTQSFLPATGQGAISPLRTRGATKANANPWLNHVLEIYSLFMFCGIFSTLLIKETKRKTLEELSEDDDYVTHHHDLPSSSGSPSGGILEKERVNSPSGSV